MADAPWGGGYHPVPYIFIRKLFSRATKYTRQICLYLVPFRSYRLSKLTTLENSTYLAFWLEIHGATPFLYFLFGVAHAPFACQG